MGLGYIRNLLGQIINPATEDSQKNGEQKTQLVDGMGNVVQTVLTESGRAIPIYQTDRTDNGYIHFHIENLTAGIYKFVIVDISDLVNYNHGNAGYAHAESFDLEVLCDVNGNWKLDAAFLEEVTDINSRFVVFDHWARNKDTGNLLEKTVYSFPVGPHLHTSKLTSHQQSITTDFQSDVAVPSTLNPLLANVFPANGDVVLKLVVAGGTVESLKFNFTYHSHDIPA